MTATDQEKLFCRVLWYVFSGLSLSASITTIILLSRMKRWNGVLLLILSLTCTEALFDCGLLLTSVSYYSGFMCQLQGVVIYFSGMSCSLWTSCFSSILLMLVTSRTFGSIQSVYRYFLATSVGIPLALTIVGIGMNFISPNYLGCFVNSELLVFEYLYDVVILVSCLYNIFAFAVTWKRINDLGVDSPSTKALRAVAMRLVYYPLVQVVCWTFIWVTLITSTGSDQADPDDFFPLLVDSLTSPLLGLGMFIAFLCHQPLARKELWRCFKKPSKGDIHRGLLDSEAPMSLSLSSMDRSSSDEVEEIRVSYSVQPSRDSFSTRPSDNDRDSFSTENPLASSNPSLSSRPDCSPSTTLQRIQSIQSAGSNAFPMRTGPGPHGLPPPSPSISQEVDYAELEDDALISIVQRQLSTDRPTIG